MKLIWMHAKAVVVHVISIRHAKITFQHLSAIFSHLEVFVLFQQVSHGAIQFTAYEELRKVIIDFKSKDSKTNSQFDDKLLVSLCNRCSFGIFFPLTV